MNLSPSDTILNRYTLISQVRETAGISVWKTKDKVLAQECLLYIINSHPLAEQIDSAASVLARLPEDRFVRVSQICTTGNVLVFTMPSNTGISLAQFIETPDGSKISFEAVRTIAGELTKTLTLINDWKIAWKLAAPETMIMCENSIKIDAFPMAPAIVVPYFSEEHRSVDDTDEAWTVRRIGALLFRLVTGKYFDPESSKLSDITSVKDVPEEFVILCRRSLGLKDEKDSKPVVPILTIAEFEALLGDWKQFEQLTKKDISLPSEGKFLAVAPMLDFAKQKKNQIIELPESLVNSKEIQNSDEKEESSTDWEPAQLLFPNASSSLAGQSDIIEHKNGDLFTVFGNNPTLENTGDDSVVGASAFTDAGAEANTGSGATAAGVSSAADAAVSNTSRSVKSASLASLATRSVPQNNDAQNNSAQKNQTQENQTLENQTPGMTSQGRTSLGRLAQGLPSQGRSASSASSFAAQTAASNYYSPSAALNSNAVPPSFAPYRIEDEFIEEEETEEEEEEEVPQTEENEENTDSNYKEISENNDSRENKPKKKSKITKPAGILFGILVLGGVLFGAVIGTGLFKSKPVSNPGDWPSDLVQQAEEDDKRNKEEDIKKEAEEKSNADPSSTPEPTISGDKTTSKVPSPNVPDNKNAYSVADFSFTNNPAGQSGTAVTIKLTQAELVSKIELNTAATGGHLQVYANSDANNPTNGSPLADFELSPDSKNVTTVVLARPTRTQNLVIWVPQSDFPKGNFFINSLKVY